MVDHHAVQRVSATMQVVNTFRKKMQNGELKVGDRLPNEADAAKAIGVGRSSFREGMRILEAYGVVEIRQGEGTFVINRFAEHVFEFMGFMPSKENLGHLINLRRVVEVGSIKMICNRLTKDECDELQTLIEGISPSKSVEENIALDMKFHESLVFYTKNPLIIQIYRMMSKMLSVLMNDLMCHDDVILDANCAHEKILSALREGDLEKSIIAIDAHLETVESYAIKYISEDWDPTA